MIKISAVSYLNTLPFIYGIEQSPYLIENSIISRDMPSDCAKKLLNNEVDLGLVPVAIIPQLKESHIITNYCIGAIGAVHTVMLYSNSPIEDVKEIILDYQSRTSVNLCKILCKEHWMVTPQFMDATEGYENHIKQNQAAVIIGDRTFKLNGTFKYEYDLAEEWQKMTHLPFVFAAWVANKKIDEHYINEFEKACAFGVQHIKEAIEQGKISFISKENQLTYLSQYISYHLDNQKQKGLDLFLQLLKKL